MTQLFDIHLNLISARITFNIDKHCKRIMDISMDLFCNRLYHFVAVVVCHSSVVAHKFEDEMRFS